ncbi:hypothetical protein BDW60DRAFT_126569 [Aspergillus nidulans var. acristatus]
MVAALTSLILYPLRMVVCRDKPATAATLLEYRYNLDKQVILIQQCQLRSTLLFLNRQLVKYAQLLSDPKS